jgi:hypothetical protein
MNEERAVESHRRTIREHIEKYKAYTQDHEKQFAWKTIQNAQQQIVDIKRRKSNIGGSWEDTWRP